MGSAIMVLLSFVLVGLLFFIDVLSQKCAYQLAVRINKRSRITLKISEAKTMASSVISMFILVFAYLYFYRPMIDCEIFSNRVQKTSCLMLFYFLTINLTQIALNPQLMRVRRFHFANLLRFVLFWVFLLLTVLFFAAVGGYHFMAILAEILDGSAY